MHKTIAALAVLLAGPANAATVVFSGTVTSEETIYTTYSDGSDSVSDTSAPYGGTWMVTFRSTSVGDFMDGDGSLPWGGDPTLTITKTRVIGEASWFDYGSGGWDGGYTYISWDYGQPVSGVVEVNSGYTDSDGNGYGQEVIYHLVGPAIAVPEPAAWALMLIGFGAMGAMVRQKRRVHD